MALVTVTMDTDTCATTLVIDGVDITGTQTICDLYLHAYGANTWSSATGSVEYTELKDGSVHRSYIRTKSEYNSSEPLPSGTVTVCDSVRSISEGIVFSDKLTDEELNIKIVDAFSKRGKVCTDEFLKGKTKDAKLTLLDSIL